MSDGNYLAIDPRLADVKMLREKINILKSQLAFQEPTLTSPKTLDECRKTDCNKCTHLKKVKDGFECWGPPFE